MNSSCSNSGSSNPNTTSSRRRRLCSYVNLTSGKLGSEPTSTKLSNSSRRKTFEIGALAVVSRLLTSCLEASAILVTS
jgi:hypothetical protein